MHRIGLTSGIAPRPVMGRARGCRDVRGQQERGHEHGAERVERPHPAGTLAPRAHRSHRDQGLTLAGVTAYAVGGVALFLKAHRDRPLVSRLPPLAMGASAVLMAAPMVVG